VCAYIIKLVVADNRRTDLKLLLERSQVCYQGCYLRNGPMRYDYYSILSNIIIKIYKLYRKLLKRPMSRLWNG